jgi:hypothetical protein
MSEVNIAPTWLSNSNTLDKIEWSKINCLTKNEINEVKAMKNEITEDDLVLEREKIEASVQNNSVYHYSSKWDNNTKSSLKEYAKVCGMDMSKFKSIDPQQVPELQKDASADTDMKTSATIDAFKIDTLGNLDHMKLANWEDIKKQSNLTDEPSMMTNALKPIRGGENCSTVPNYTIAKGTNSMFNPNAIKEYIESNEDTGARLKKQKADRLEQKKSEHNGWQQEKISQMENSEIIPKGMVFPTECLNAQSGIKQSTMGVYSKYDIKDIPDKTKGELIAESNEKRRKEIQGEDKEKFEFSLKKASTFEISSSLTEELKKLM